MIICPKCQTDKYMSWDSSFSFEDYCYEGEGVVSFYECLKCGTTIEICIPEKSPYEDGDDK